MLLCGAHGAPYMCGVAQQNTEVGALCAPGFLYSAPQVGGEVDIPGRQDGLHAVVHVELVQDC